MKTRIVRGINRVLAHLSWRLAPMTTATVRQTFFTPPANCQIPNLGFLYELVFGRREHGLVVEVGAFDGVSFSNSSCLIERGWQAILVEPVPEYAAQCRSQYTGVARVDVVEVACGAVVGTAPITKAGALSSMNLTQVDEYRSVEWAHRAVEASSTAQVTVTTLDEVLVSRSVAPGFEVLVVDVEGSEADVLAGFDLLKWRPQLMIWELSDAHPDLVALRATSTVVGDAILDSNYRVIYKDAINTVFLHRDVNYPS